MNGEPEQDPRIEALESLTLGAWLYGYSPCMCNKIGVYVYICMYIHIHITYIYIYTYVKSC